MEKILEVKDLTVSREGVVVFADLSFDLYNSDVCLLLGKNGAGKSTLALTLLGHSKCRVDKGSILFLGYDLTGVPTFRRAIDGIFLAHQEPPAISGVSVVDILRVAVETRIGDKFSYPSFHNELLSALHVLDLDYAFAKKELHTAFSGGEKKKIELLTLLMLKPKLALLDELDAGMDELTRDKLLLVISRLRELGTAFLVITHRSELYASLLGVKSLNI